MTEQRARPLHAEYTGSGRRLVLLHGFTQNLRCWAGLDERLAADHEVVTVDAPGHGWSGHDDADLWRAADLIGDVGGTAVYVGYSMGGRMALHLALARPDLVQGLVLIGATAGIDDDDERAERRRADNRLADRLLEIGGPAFIDQWLASPLFASLPEAAASRGERLRNRVDGMAANLRACGTGNQRPLWDRLAELRMPVLLLTGQADPKFTHLAQRLARSIGQNAEAMTRPGGHALHLEDPDSTALLIGSFTVAGPSA